MSQLIYRKQDRATYERELREMIYGHEDGVGYVYLDNNGVPTIGVGRALVVLGRGRVWVPDPQAIRDLSSTADIHLNPSQLAILDKAASGLNANGIGPTTLKQNTPLFYTPETPNDSSEKSRQVRTRDATRSIFGVSLHADDIRRLADITISRAESGLNKKMKDTGVKIPPFSKERQVLVSIQINKPSLFNDMDLAEALTKGDRAAIIRAMEALAKKEGLKGVRVRRESEIKAFGRPGDPEVLRNDQDSQRELEAVFKGRAGAGTHPRTGFYIWRTQRDDVVRSEHAVREGQVFSWENPPPGGHPGEAYGCRCRAEPLKGPGY